MFEQALRLKLRFEYRGQCTVEDLWDVPVTDLDNLYQQYQEQLDKGKGSLLKKSVTTNANALLELKSNIVKHIVETKLAEAKEKRKAVERSEKKQRVMQIIAEKQDDELKGKSVKELKQLMKEL